MNTTYFSAGRIPAIQIEKSWIALPAIRGIIDRRMLVNFRCDPAVLKRFLPRPFRPKLIQGWAMAGICLIRLRAIRPTGIPALFGATSENAAHRIAVEWEQDGQTREGVFILRRDTDSLLNQIAGGRLFPGQHHKAAFRVWESGSRFKLEMHSVDGAAFVRVLARVTDTLSGSSVFGTLADASAFFQGGALGWSSRRAGDGFDGLELCCEEWRMEPLAVERVESSFFSNCEWFPPGSAEFDSALLMRGLAHEWRARGKLTMKSF
jgi:hypothetical protein